MNIIIIDDEKSYLKSIEEKIKIWCEKNGNSSIMLHPFTSSEDALDEIQKGLQVDTVFLDIEIPGEMNGLAFALKLHSINENIPIIFITNYAEYALDGYRVNALRFLHKPVTEQSVFECMDIVWKRWNILNSNCITIDTGSQALRLPIDKIIYIEVMGHYSIINTTNSNQKYKFKITLNEISNRLPPQVFVQCHRCYIVNLMYIRYIYGKNMTLSDGTNLTIGRTYQNNLMQKFREFYLRG